MYPSVKYFKSAQKKIKLPLFFPDATRAVVKTLDSIDVKKCHTPGILVNTLHLYEQLGLKVLNSFDGIASLMSWSGTIISDSGGFQVMSLAKSAYPRGKVNNKGVIFYPSRKKRVLFTPEKSIRFQFALKTDLMVVLDDFTPPKADKKVF